MTDLLGTISKQFGKSLVLGALVPVVAAAFGFCLLLNPFLAAGEAPGPLQPLGWSEGEAALAALTVVLVTGLVFNLNPTILRLYQGYSWQHGRLGTWLADRHRVRLARARLLRPGLRALGETLPAGGAGGLSPGELQRLRTRVAHEIFDDFPSSPGSVLPTRLGNVIRCFEHYPRWQYGMSAVPLWPRLTAVIDDGYAARVADEKAQVDFFLNGSLLSVLLAAALVGAALVRPAAVATPAHLGLWLVQLVGLLALAYGLYRGAVERARSWGLLVRGAFDLYRHDLLERLGVGRTPQTRTEERALWAALSMQLLYGDPPSGRLAEPVERTGAAATVVVARPAVELAWCRTVEPLRDGRVAVTLEVRNRDGRAATRIDVTERLPEGYHVEHASARLDDRPAALDGAGPHHVVLPGLAPGETTRIYYHMVPLST